MRKVGKEGRAIVRSFSYPKNKDDMIEKLESLARQEGISFSDIILEGLEKYWLEHGDSQNPQTKISLYETGMENAIPNLYRDKSNWEKFYSLIKNPKDYKLLDEKINMVMNLHNKKYQEFS